MSLRVRAAIFLVEDGKLLLAEHQKEGRTYFLLPGGGVDSGESWGEAAAREAREELGVEVEVHDLLAAYENEAPDGSRRILHAILSATRTSGEPHSTGEDPRVVGARWVEAKELSQLDLRPALAEEWSQWILEEPPLGACWGRLPWIP